MAVIRNVIATAVILQGNRAHAHRPVQVFCPVMANGLWTLKSWAYWTTLVLEVLNILFNLFQLGQPNHTIFGILSGGLLSIIIVVYLLFDRNVREAFQA